MAKGGFKEGIKVFYRLDLNFCTQFGDNLERSEEMKQKLSYVNE